MFNADQSKFFDEGPEKASIIVADLGKGHIHARICSSCFGPLMDRI